MQILVITSIYPGADTPKSFTPVVHYFVREWVKMGCDVRVIHTCTYFPSIYYKAPQWVRKYLQRRTGIALPEKKLDKELEYEYEGVKVYRIPMKKYLPMSNYSSTVISRSCEKVAHFINEEGFTPQHIISHWLNPQLLLMSYLKDMTGAVTTMVLHGAFVGMEKQFKEWDRLSSKVDIWGYRAEKTQIAFEKICGKQRYSFRCLSGIPSYYIENAPLRDGSFSDRFIQVGMLIERKYPNKTIDALNSVYGNSSFSLRIIGEGTMRESLESQIKKLYAQDRIILPGRMPRNEVMKQLDNSDVFILISRQEIFGLVYIEAMARGCIVIASRGEGMEGIIDHGVNGFLCEAGNSEELAGIIDQIRKMTNLQRKTISAAAVATSQQLTDVIVAKNYIETVVNFGNIIKQVER